MEGTDLKSDEERSVSSSIDEFPSLNAAFSENLPEEFTPETGALSPTDNGDLSPQSNRRRSWINNPTNLGRQLKFVGPLKNSANNIKNTKPSLKVDGTL